MAVLSIQEKKGVLCLLVNELQKALQWPVSILHAEDLPPRPIFKYIDSDSTCPNEFSGKIGKKLSKCESLPQAQFTPIP